MNEALRAKLSAVTKSYPSPAGPRAVLSDVSLDLSAGTVVALHGPSGSGKTTLLNLLGLLDAPDSGLIEIDGEDMASVREKDRAPIRNSRIGFVFQSADLIPKLSAVGNVALPLEIGGMARRKALEEADKVLASVGMSEHRDKRPEELSGGQTQRTAIARALVNRPALLIADEPTSNLDTENALAVMKLIRDLCHEQGTAAAIATHDDRLLELVDRTIRLEDGRIVSVSETGRA